MSTKGALSLPGYGLGGKIKKGLKKAAHLAKDNFMLPATVAKDVVHGDIKGAFKDVANTWGETGEFAAPYVGLIPGIGPLAGGAIGAGSGLLAGDGLKGALKYGTRGALSGLAGSALGGAPGIIDKLGGAATGFLSTGELPFGLTAGSLLKGAAGLAAVKGLTDAGKGTGGGGASGNPMDGGSGGLSDQQRLYYNLPSISWDQPRLADDAGKAGLSIGQYVARNWGNVSGGAYNAPYGATGAAPTQTAQANPAWQQTTPYQELPANYAHGGALGFARGAGSGRADTINARLSDGEYVMDAETVAMLGDGSSSEGAKRLDQMRQDVRKHKGAALKKGKFSPNAKPPLSYLKGAK